jgi:hypothetical protein
MPEWGRAARRAVAAAIVAVVVSACASGITGTPVAAPAGTGSGLVYDERTAPYAAEFARIRTVDLCALHDVASAEKATGAARERIHIINALASCVLEVGTPRPSATWHIELSVGTERVDEWVPTQVGGVDLRKRPDESRGCQYVLPIAEAVGFTVRAGYTQAARSGPEPSPAAVCRTIEQYLSETVLPRWRTPPLLTAGLTTPRIPLLGKDPCAALAAGVAGIKERPGDTRSFAMSDPYSCEGGRGSAARRYAVEFVMLSPVLDMTGPPTRFGEYTAYEAKAIGAGGCSYDVPMGPDLPFSAEGSKPYRAGISIGVLSCAETEVVAKVIENVAAQPDPAPARPGAQELGDLTGR